MFIHYEKMDFPNWLSISFGLGARNDYGQLGITQLNCRSSFWENINSLLQSLDLADSMGGNDPALSAQHSIRRTYQHFSYLACLFLVKKTKWYKSYNFASLFNFSQSLANPTNKTPRVVGFWQALLSAFLFLNSFPSHKNTLPGAA